MAKRSFEHLLIGPGHRGRIVYYAIAIGVAWGFIYLFVQLAREWQVALGAVTLIAVILLLNGYHAQRTADALDHTAD